MAIRTMNKEGMSLRYALKLLKFRGRSEKEMESRLAHRHFPRPVVEDTLRRLRRDGLLNDFRLAEERVQFFRQRGEGEDGIRDRLSRIGVSQSAIDEAFARVAKNETPLSEEERAWDVLTRQGKRHKVVDLGTCRRLAAYLGRKGYSSECVENAMERYLAMRGKEYEREN